MHNLYLYLVIVDIYCVRLYLYLVYVYILYMYIYCVCVMCVCVLKKLANWFLYFLNVLVDNNYFKYIVSHYALQVQQLTLNKYWIIYFVLITRVEFTV